MLSLVFHILTITNATLLTLLLMKNRPQNSQQRYETGR